MDHNNDTPPPELWGLSGDGWLMVRPVPDQRTAYSWAGSFAERPGVATTIYVDRGAGWRAVDTITPAVAR